MIKMTYKIIYFPYPTNIRSFYMYVWIGKKKVRFGAKPNDHFTQAHLD